MTVLAGIEIPVGSRYSIHENPNVAPGFCCVCKHPGGDGRAFIDFGFQLDWYGAVYFCSDCVRELCSVINFVPKAEADKAIESARVACDNATHLEKEFGDYRDFVRNLLRNCSCDDSRNGSSAVSSNSAKSRTEAVAVADDRKPDKASGK